MLVIVDLDDPLNPKHVATVPMNDARGVYLQFRYAFVTDAEGLKVVDVTDPNNPKLTPNNVINLSNAIWRSLSLNLLIKKANW